MPIRARSPLSLPAGRHDPAAATFLPLAEGGVAVGDVVPAPGYWKGRPVRFHSPTQEEPDFTGLPVCHLPEGPAAGGYDNNAFGPAVPSALPRFADLGGGPFYVTRFLGGFRPGRKGTLVRAPRSVYVGWSRAPHAATEQPAEQDAPEYADVCESVLLPRRAGLYCQFSGASGSQLTSCVPVADRAGTFTEPFAILIPRGVVVLIDPGLVTIEVDGDVYDTVTTPPGANVVVTQETDEGFNVVVTVYVDGAVEEVVSVPPDALPATHRVPHMTYAAGRVVGGECLLLAETAAAFYATAAAFSPQLVVNSGGLAYEAQQLAAFAARFSRFRVVLVYQYNTGDALLDAAEASVTATLAGALSGLEVFTRAYDVSNTPTAEAQWRQAVAEHAQDFWPQ